MSREKKIADLEFYLMQGLSVLSELKKDQEEKELKKPTKLTRRKLIEQHAIMRRQRKMFKTPA